MPDVFPFACVVLPGDADAATIADAVERASGAGARPVIIPLPASAPRPPGAQVVTVHDGMPETGALRRALAALANSPAVGLLLWQAGEPASLPAALAVIDAARRSGAAVVVPRRAGERAAPTWYGRDTWLELMTLTEQGFEAIDARHPSAIEFVEVTDALA